MKSLIRWTAILSLVSISGFESLLFSSQQVQALPANAVLISQKTVLDYIERARSRAHAGDLQGVIDNASQAIKLKPTLAQAYGIRAAAHNELGDFQQALADANQAVKLKPQSSTIYKIRANAHIGLGNFQQALADANQAVKLKPQSALAYKVRVKAHIGLGNFQQALADASQVVKLKPQSALAYGVRARVRIGLGDIEGGLADAKQAIQINPKDGDGYYSRGLARLKQGDQQGATADYNQAIQKEPSLAKELENYTQTAQNQVPDTKTATASPSSKPAQSPQSAQDVYAIAGQTTVLIDGQNPGSGVILAKTSNTYYVLTAKHVVATPDEYKIIVAGGKAYDVDTNKIKRLSNLDLAIVEFTSNQNYPVARIGNSDQVKQGANIYVSGWPLPDQAISKPTQIVTEGRVVGLQADGKDGYGLLYGNNTAPGMSGGPVLDAKGQVVGIHGRAAGNQTSGKVGINLGIPINLFLQSANQAGINLQQMGLKAQN